MKLTGFFFYHLILPAICKTCKENNYYWMDGTFGCANGHVVAHHNPNLDYSIWRFGKKGDN